MLIVAWVLILSVHIPILSSVSIHGTQVTIKFTVTLAMIGHGKKKITEN